MSFIFFNYFGEERQTLEGFYELQTKTGGTLSTVRHSYVTLAFEAFSLIKNENTVKAWNCTWHESVHMLFQVQGVLKMLLLRLKSTLLCPLIRREKQIPSYVVLEKDEGITSLELLGRSFNSAHSCHLGFCPGHWAGEGWDATLRSCLYILLLAFGCDFHFSPLHPYLLLLTQVPHIALAGFSFQSLSLKSPHYFPGISHFKIISSIKHF